MRAPLVGALTKSDPDYLTLKRKGRSRVVVTADQIVTLLDWIMERDEQIKALKKEAA